MALRNALGLTRYTYKGIFLHCNQNFERKHILILSINELMRF